MNCRQDICLQYESCKKKSELSCLVSPGNSPPEQLKDFLTLSMFVNDLKVPTQLILGFQINFREWMNLQILKPWIKTID